MGSAASTRQYYAISELHAGLKVAGKTDEDIERIIRDLFPDVKKELFENHKNDYKTLPDNQKE